jgi:hypothetical protein
MDDPNNGPSNFLFNVLCGYIGTWLFTVNSQLVEWLSPRVLRAIRWLHDRNQRSRTVTLQLPSSVSISTSTGSGNITTLQPEPLPPGTASAVVMAMQPYVAPTRIGQHRNNSQLAKWDALQQRFAEVALRFPQFVPNPQRAQWEADARRVDAMMRGYSSAYNAHTYNSTTYNS